MRYRPVPEVSAHAQHANPGRSGRSTLQLQRKASGKKSPADGEFWFARRTGTLISEITQETLAEMIGATRSRVDFFMNRFRAGLD
jgi:hypothetical protein